MFGRLATVGRMGIDECVEAIVFEPLHHIIVEVGVAEGARRYENSWFGGFAGHLVKVLAVCMCKYKEPSKVSGTTTFPDEWENLDQTDRKGMLYTCFHARRSDIRRVRLAAGP